jgi:threonine aldolase
MTIECYTANCPKHGIHFGDDGPFCYEEECVGIAEMSQEIDRLHAERDALRTELEELERVRGERDRLQYDVEAVRTLHHWAEESGGLITPDELAAALRGEWGPEG